jgi:hypothetical protein
VDFRLWIAVLGITVRSVPPAMRTVQQGLELDHGIT